MLRHVVDAAKSAAFYLNNFTFRTKLRVEVALCVPEGDEIASQGSPFRRNQIHIFEGSETDVLSRYAGLGKKFDADYVVRVTGDCPLIPHFLITKHIKTAVVNGYDYLSNVDPKMRTAVDGHDCEVMSRQMLEYLDATAKGESDREHVTPLARDNPPAWARVGHVVGFLNLSHVKLSVDTPDDLEHVRLEYSRVKEALEHAQGRVGKPHVHRL